MKFQRGDYVRFSPRGKTNKAPGVVLGKAGTRSIPGHSQRLMYEIAPIVKLRRSGGNFASNFATGHSTIIDSEDLERAIEVPYYHEAIIDRIVAFRFGKTPIKDKGTVTIARTRGR